jgi:hypothetical protein
MKNKIPQKSFDAQMHIIRDVHFDVDKYKVGELYAIKHKVDLAHTIDGKIVGELTAVDPTMLRFNIFIGWCKNSGATAPKPERLYSIEPLELSINEIIDKRIEIERLLTETEAAVYLTSVFVKESANDLFKAQLAWQKGPVGVDYFCTPEKYQGDISVYSSLKSDIQAAYKINTPEEAVEIAKDSQMNIVDDIMKAAEEEKKNYAVWLTGYLSGLSKPFSILDSEGNFDPVPFDGLTTGSGRVRVKLVKGYSTVQFNVHSKYIKVTSDEIIITGNKNKSSICMTLMRDNFREMFDKIEFEQIL